MMNPLITVGIFAALSLAAVPAQSCMVQASTRLEDVHQYASIVVVGRIENYRIVPNRYGDYARFDIRVDKVLKGSPPKTLTVTWDASTFGNPKTMPAGQYVIALRDPASKAPPLRGPSATIFPAPEPGRLTVLNPPCTTGFIFPSASPEAVEIGRILKR